MKEGRKEERKREREKEKNKEQSHSETGLSRKSNDKEFKESQKEFDSITTCLRGLEQVILSVSVLAGH